ncbi:MAG: hypothetical protein UZ09_BCD002000275 [Bacteroidetes bacterium OLB9]|nr:MAG: hypothetical protein UZ09_BCD002000275 [Bacteroidetes bacterium OLB9]
MRLYLLSHWTYSILDMHHIKFIIVKSLIVLFFTFASITIFAQDKGVFSGGFETNVNMFLRDSSINAINTPQYDHQLVGGEAWLNLNYSIHGYTIGARFDMYQNSNLRNPTGSYSGSGIGQWFISKELNNLEVSAGYLYDQIGSGFIFRAFETRPLFIDNALYGARLKYNFSDTWHLMGFMGKQKNAFDTYSGNLKGIRAEGFLSFGNEDSPVTLAPGIGFVNKTLSDEYMNEIIDVVRTYQEVDKFIPKYNTYAATIYNTLSYKSLNLYTEFALKSDDTFFNPYIEKTELVGNNTLGKLMSATGSVAFVSASFAKGGLGITAEMKRTENFSFRVDPNLTLLKGLINYLTPINRQNTYRLTARYNPAALDISEMAYSLDLRYKFNKSWSANINLSDIKTIEGDQLFQEIFTEVMYKHKRKWQLTTGIQAVKYNQEIYETKAEVPLVKTLVPYADFLYKFNSRKSLRIEAQYMNTDQDYGSWLFGLAEFNIAPKWSFEASGMYNIDPKKTNAKGALEKTLYPTLGIVFFNKSQRYSLRYVKQVEGVVCSGGICRLEPAFSGMRFTMNTIF